MNKLTFLKHGLLILLIALMGCDKDDGTLENCIDNNPEFIPETISDAGGHQLIIYSNSKINLNTENGYNDVFIVDGDKSVFYYSYYEDPYPMAIDDEFQEVIVFEIDPKIDEFLISGADLKKSNAFFGNICFCSPAGYFPITSGCIKGKKINDSEWQVDINILAEKEKSVFTKMLSERFINE
jgi:hypothetical protein